MTVMRCSGPPPRGYLTCNDSRCSFADPSEEPHAHDSPEIRAWQELLPRLRRYAGADERPGFYYVSAIDGERRSLVRGPFSTHRAALDAVEATKATVGKLDGRAWSYAWGTARCETDAGPGALDVWEASKKD